MPVLSDLPHVLRPAAAAPEGALVLLHGQGASEQDPAGLLDVLDPQRRLVGACPRGTMAARDSIGYHWYTDREPGYPHSLSFEDTFTTLGGWLALLAQETGVPPERTIIGGFGQGATMAWALVLGQGRPRAGGLIAYSGFIPRVSDFELDEGSLSGLPVAIIHGEKDPKVPVDFARSAYERAKAAGADLFYRETDISQGLDLRLIPDLAWWVSLRP